ncbi:VOC family protein [Aeromicrobium wangtongii]|uniref:VOC family protein n=1 Tax=Aeromicrobium wangtongii TaxID=2969247 RepID=A0ABY5M8F2_9ACTN|nr:VOC family protein [Aeromicrobium wangtongii]MCD9199773.1 VOC family protein [Aeromicrobium wangtongii]UUP14122.1 VOC family protein [Aeromicrobium wangtongii]
MTAVASIRTIVLECSAPEPLAQFWSAVLDRPIVNRDDDWWDLEPSPGGPRMAFQVSPGYEPPAWPGTSGEQQSHLDLEVDDLETARARVLELGARQLSEVIDESEDDGVWQVFADPAGHPFCLVT